MVHLPFSSVSSTHPLRFALLYFTLLSCHVCLSTHFYCSIHSILFAFFFVVHAIHRSTHCGCFPSRWKSANRRRMFRRHTIIVCAQCVLLMCRQWKFITRNRYLVIQWWYDWHSNDEQIPQCDHLMISPILFTSFTDVRSFHMCTIITILSHWKLFFVWIQQMKR